MRVTQSQSFFGSATHSGWPTTLPIHTAATRKSIFVAAHPLKKCNCPVYRTCRFRDEPDEQALTSISEPIRWLKSGALVLNQEQEKLVSGSAAQKVTIGFDKHGHGSVLKVKAKKVTEDALDKDPQLLVLPKETAYFQAIASNSINDLTVRVSDRDGHLHQGDNDTS